MSDDIGDQAVVVSAKDVYGSVKYYPACPFAEMLCDITGTKTLTPSTVRILKKYGHEVYQEHVVNPELKELEL
jgi:ATP phosphoribosyltransferase|tara:strand:- start:14376 stop:14594 length:219 start_codon:yes stop_codon:yes gene_type:complete